MDFLKLQNLYQEHKKNNGENKDIWRIAELSANHDWLHQMDLDIYTPELLKLIFYRERKYSKKWEKIYWEREH